MSNAHFDNGLNAFLKGEIAWLTDTIKAILVDTDDFAKTITDATNASPIQITATGHGLTTGDKVSISGVTGNTAANGLFRVIVVDANTLTLTGSTGNGIYTNGGKMVDLSNLANLSDIPSGARIATATLANKTAIRGVADADDITFTGVTGDTYEAIVIYKDSGTEATSPLIVYFDNVQGLPATPSGGNVLIAWDNSVNKIFAV